MKTPIITTIIILAATLGLIGYDIWVAIESTPNDTISWIMLSNSLKHPIIAWLWGGLTGHLFWPMSRYGSNHIYPIPFCDVDVSAKTYRWVALSVLIVLTITLLVLDISSKLTIHPAIVLVLAIPAGHFGWPQYKE